VSSSIEKRAAADPPRDVAPAQLGETRLRSGIRQTAVVENQAVVQLGERLLGLAEKVDLGREELLVAGDRDVAARHHPGDGRKVAAAIYHQTIKKRHRIVTEDATWKFSEPLAVAL